MAANKKSKSSAKSRGAKKSASKRQPARGSAKTAPKRSRRNGSKGQALNSPRGQLRARTVSPATPLATAALGREPERKSLKKSEARPNRPPAVLPIPQSTFFF